MWSLYKMSTYYESLTRELKSKVSKAEYKAIFKNLNRNIDTKDEKLLTDLVQKIEIEQNNIAKKAEKLLTDLAKLNEVLVRFNESPQESLTKARELLKTKVFINIYDLTAEKYQKRTTKKKLRTNLKYNPDRRFPLNVAKKYMHLRCFLIQV